VGGICRKSPCDIKHISKALATTGGSGVRRCSQHGAQHRRPGSRPAIPWWTNALGSWNDGLIEQNEREFVESFPNRGGVPVASGKSNRGTAMVKAAVTLVVAIRDPGPPWRVYWGTGPLSTPLRGFLAARERKSGPLNRGRRKRFVVVVPHSASIPGESIGNSLVSIALIRPRRLRNHNSQTHYWLLGPRSEFLADSLPPSVALGHW